MTSRILSILCVATLLLHGQLVGAIEVLSAKELASHCEAIPESRDSTDGQYCIRYIQGFVDGAVATDERVMLNLDAEYARKETYSERIIRQRAADRGSFSRAAGYAEFCLGDPVPLRDVVDRIVSDLFQRKHFEPEHTARDVVYASLRKHYPCENPATKQ